MSIVPSIILLNRSKRAGMPVPPSMRFIRNHIYAGTYRLTGHSTLRRLERGIALSQIEDALLNGEIIERNPNGNPYPTSLILGWLTSGDPLHIVCSRGNAEPALRIVTVYEPDDSEWQRDYKTRR